MTELWTNWAGDQRCAPSTVERPRSEQQLIGAVLRAVARGEAVRAVGSGHSFTDCACTDGVLIDMSGMQRVLSVDQASGRATVEGGIKLDALGSQLARHGLALENQGDIDRQSIAGAIATATHGTGARLANLSAQIRGSKLVHIPGAGHLSSVENPEAFNAAVRQFLGGVS